LYGVGLLNCADQSGARMPQAAKSSSTNHNLRFADFVVDLRAGNLQRDGVPVRLQDQPFQILTLLAQNAGEIVTREELRRHLWPADTFVDFDNSLNTAINKIREALGDSAEDPLFIETLPRRGYRFVALVERLRTNVVAIHAQRSTQVQDSDSGYLVTPSDRSQGGDAEGTGTIATGTSPSVRLSSGSRCLESLAVLPFENTSGDPDAEYLSDGIAESLMNSLSQVGTLRVVSRSTAFRYKGRQAAPQAVGRELGVQAVLTGRLVQRGESLHVAAELVDVETDSQLWGEHYNRKFSDIFEIQESIATAISEKLVLRMTGRERKTLLVKRYTENQQAYQDYLKGQYFFSKWTEQGMKKSFEYFHRAIERDPAYPLPYIGLAQFHNYMSTLEFASPIETIPKSLAAATRALELDSSLAEAYNYLAFHKFSYAWDWAGASELFERAIALRPDFVLTHLWRCLFFCAIRNIPEAMKASQTVIALDPLSPNAYYFASIPHYLVRDFDTALQYAHKALELDATFGWAHWIVGLVYEEEHKFERAIAAHRMAVETSGRLTRMLCSLGHVYGLVGRTSEAEAVVSELGGRARVNYISAFAFATVYLGLRDFDKFFEWLERAFAERSYWLVFLDIEIKYDTVRSDPRFQDLIRRLGFPR
jgi:TolB-like protein/DNA-binding winged helix-turn-helix (wHTH) protein